MRFTQIFGSEYDAPRVTVSDDDANGWTVGPAYALTMAAIAGTVASASMAAQIANSRYDSGEIPIAAPTAMVVQDDAPPRTIVFDEQRLTAAVRSWQADDETPTLKFVNEDDAAPHVVLLDEQRLAQAVRSWQTDDETPTLRFALDAEQRAPSVVWAPDLIARPTWQDEEIISLTIDEDTWKALEPEWPSSIIAAQWSWDDGNALPIQSGSSVPDEWAWIPPIPPAPPTPPAAWRFDADESISTVGGAPEELGWIPPTPPVIPAPAPAWRFDSDEFISTVGGAFEEYTWSPPAPSVQPITALAPFDDGGMPIAAAVSIVDEDGWRPLSFFAADFLLPAPWANDEGAQPALPVSDVDECDWPVAQTRRSTIGAPFVRLTAWDGLETGTLVPVPPTVRPATEPTVAFAKSVKSIAHPVDPDGVVMDVSTLEFTQGETGPVTIYVGGEDGIPEDLSTVQSAKWNLRAKNGRIIVKRVDVSGKTSGGHFIWTRLDAEVARAGIYVGQLEIVRFDGTRGELPTGGLPVIIKPAVIVAGA